MLGMCSVSESQTDFCNNINSSIPWPRKSKKKFTVAVEGNIGSGKSTFLKYFEDSKSVEVMMEPVDKWKDVHGHNTLELMYKDAQRYSLTFQSYVQLTMLQNHCYKQKAPVKLLERSIYSAKYCFVENLYKNGLMPGVDYAVLSEWFDWIVRNENTHIDLFVYLRATPETCLQRLKKRNRSEEAGVSIDYVESLHELHEDWLLGGSKFQIPAPVLVLDANKELEILVTDFEKKRSEILCGYS